MSEGRSGPDPYCVIVAGSPDVIVVGAGVVGASCAYHLAASGARVELLDRSFVASGSSGACEGNVLAWDKELERELPLALRSAELWAELAERLPDDFEYDRKGSVVVAETAEELAASAERAQILAGLGVKGEVLDAGALRREEPYAAHDLPGGVLYPGDAQLEPRLATAALVKAAGAKGASLTIERSVDRLLRSRDGRVTAIETSGGRIPAGAVVIAAGVWTPALLETAGLSVPVTPRKGQIVVLERSPVRFRRKLSEAGYVAAVEADDAALQIAMVVESTVSGTALLGSSRQHVGFDREIDLAVAAAIARRAARFFPILHDARALRVYAGLRPLTPDHVPIVGPFAEAPNLCVATGHEGAGIGLAPATGELVAAWHSGEPSPLPIEWFSPDRFAPVELAAT
jgi:glycine/D-amino acid oxidase-like deaminating enzyme